MSAPSIQLRRIAQVNPYTPGFDLLPDDAEVTFLPLEAVWPAGRADITRRATKADVSNGYTRFQCGDILLPKVSPTFQAGRVMVANIDTAFGAATTEVHVVRSAGEADARFLAYTLQSIPFLQEGSTTLQGVGNLRRVPPEFVREYPVLHVEPTEQRAIAGFLDRDTAQIDAMVDSQERLVALLEERKRSLILGAVTGSWGSSNASRYPSGLRWAGDIPSHWEVGNIRRFAQMKTGHTPSRQHPEYWERCTIPWFTLADVWQLRAGRSHVTETSEMISELGLANSAAELLPAGTVMLSRTASVGFSGIMSIPMATSQDYWNWVCGPQLVPEYLLYTFHAMFDELRSLTAGSTHKTIYEADAASLRIVVPPVNEQRGIVSYLEEQLERIGRLVVRAQESIALMKERRSALISAAVTGRIDVRTGVEQAERDLEEVGA